MVPTNATRKYEICSWITEYDLASWSRSVQQTAMLLLAIRIRRIWTRCPEVHNAKGGSLSLSRKRIGDGWPITKERPTARSGMLPTNSADAVLRRAARRAPFVQRS